jgi:hypothetical protein
MNRIRLLFVTLCPLFALAFGMQGQTVNQSIKFSLFGNYQTNTVSTNVTDEGVVTNTRSITPLILITAANVVKALAVDQFGKSWTNWSGASLVREINLATTNEAIYVRKGTNQFNVSANFGVTFSNDFTGTLAADFPQLSNFNSQTNAGSPTNFIPPIQINRGTNHLQSGTNLLEYTLGYGLHSLSLHTTNLQFNVVGTSSGTYTNVYGKYLGVRYSQRLQTELVSVVGIFSLNTTTNIYNTGTNPPVFLGGPLHGSFSINTATFLPISYGSADVEPLEETSSGAETIDVSSGASSSSFFNSLPPSTAGAVDDSAPTPP